VGVDVHVDTQVKEMFIKLDNALRSAVGSSESTAAMLHVRDTSALVCAHSRDDHPKPTRRPCNSHASSSHVCCVRMCVCLPCVYMQTLKQEVKRKTTRQDVLSLVLSRYSRTPVPSMMYIHTRAGSEDSGPRTLQIRADRGPAARAGRLVHAGQAAVPLPGLQRPHQQAP
jgi:hypothetical protein